MKKILALAFVAVCGTAVPTIAQITTGTPTARHIRTGNRAQKGDYGIYLGMSSNMFKGIADKNIKFENPLPLVNLKYMVTDHWEARVGLQFSKTKEKVTGDVITGTNGNDDGDWTTEDYSWKYVEADNLIKPGFAYHFSRHNLLDVYAGAELPIGWVRNTVKGEQDGEDWYQKKGSFQLGVGAFIGLQAYIGDLPLALGVEYGISAMSDLGCKYKFKNGKQEYTTVDPEKLPHYEGVSDRFDGLKARRCEVGNQFSITLTYFFK